MNDPIVGGLRLGRSPRCLFCGKAKLRQLIEEIEMGADFARNRARRQQLEVGRRRRGHLDVLECTIVKFGPRMDAETPAMVGTGEHRLDAP